MTRYAATLAVVAVFAALAGFFAARQLQPDPAPHKAGAALPTERAVAASVVPFSLPDLDNRVRDIGEWKGDVIVLNFWATWCPPCRDEIPAFMKLQEAYAARGLQVVGVAIDEIEAVRDYRDELFINYPILVGDRDAVDIMKRYGNLAGVLPYSVVIGRDGRIEARKQGAYTHDDLEAIVKPLL